MPPPIPENTYKHDVDFTALALQYSDFAAKLKLNRQLDFTDPESVKQLTLSLLHRDFNLTLSLPDDRLYPPVPNRFNYILFLSRLLSSTSPTFRDTYDSKREVIGVDIGTGASAIYPLLGCRQHPAWKFLCTEIDEQSRSYTQSNIERNDLDARIKIMETDATSKQLVPLEALKKAEKVDFLMTNPPFYASTSEMFESAKSKSRPPNSACTGAPIEMIYPYTPSTTSKASKPNQNEGGEVAFVSQLIQESTNPELQERIQWYSAMLGKLSSLTILINKLKDQQCTNYALTEFIQGQKTRRWCLAWSWQSFRPPSSLARGIPALEKKLLPFPSEFEFEVDGTVRSIGESVDEILEQLEDEDPEDRLSWQWKPNLMVGLGIAKADCWSRKARRTRKKGDSEMKDADGDEDEAEEKEPALVFKISVKHDPISTTNESKKTVSIRWLQGGDTVLFESFCGWLKRKVEDR